MRVTRAEPSIHFLHGFLQGMLNGLYEALKCNSLIFRTSGILKQDAQQMLFRECLVRKQNKFQEVAHAISQIVSSVDLFF